MDIEIERGSIVVGVDGSQHADRALRWAATQADLEHRPLVVAVTREQSGADLIAEDALSLVAELAPGVRRQSVVTDGDPRTLLIQLAERAHLVVIGSRGRGPLRSLLLGSVSNTVSKIATCPVVVCRPRQPGDDGAGHGVLVGVDGTPEGQAVLEFAFAQASLRGQPLTAVHCTWDVVAAVAGLRDLRPEDLEPGTVEELRLLLAESLAGFREKYPDVPVTLRVTHGLVDNVLASESQRWDLVVVGRHPIDHIGRLVTGSIATAVLERARTNVAVVPQAGSTG